MTSEKTPGSILKGLKEKDSLQSKPRVRFYENTDSDDPRLRGSPVMKVIELPAIKSEGSDLNESGLDKEAEAERIRTQEEDNERLQNMLQLQSALRGTRLDFPKAPNRENMIRKAVAAIERDGRRDELGARFSIGKEGVEAALLAYLREAKKQVHAEVMAAERSQGLPKPDTSDAADSDPAASSAAPTRRSRRAFATGGDDDEPFHSYHIAPVAPSAAASDAADVRRDSIFMPSAASGSSHRDPERQGPEGGMWGVLARQVYTLATGRGNAPTDSSASSSASASSSSSGAKPPKP